MTSEVIVMNKAAIALAADSAITVGSEGQQKTFNTGNKLFSLSKYHPIAIMIFGNAEFMLTPWETIIKVYRKNLDKKKFDTTKEYADNFISYIESSELFCDKEIQKGYFQSMIISYMNELVKEINKRVEESINKNSSITNDEIIAIVDNLIQEQINIWEKYPIIDTLPKEYPEQLLELYGENIKNAKDELFQKLPISEKSNSEITKLLLSLFYRKRFPESKSGIVIAGFGEKEIFPSAYSYECECVVAGKLKYAQKQIGQVKYDNQASIMPFAQREMVDAFIQGIDPNLLKVLDKYTQELVRGYNKKILEIFPEIPSKKKEKYTELIGKASEAILKDYKEKFLLLRRTKFIGPIMNIVAVLPKDELAAMAEALVNLTSFRRRISLEMETVGGPIDVAIVSKGDGFIWVKRKHYFQPELNHAFFTNYFEENS